MALIVAMFGFSLAMSISPGPVNILTVSSGANHGFARTMPFVSGATIGFTLLLLAIGLGMSELVASFPALLDVMVYLGGAFVAYMGLQMLDSTTSGITLSKQRAPGFTQGFLLQWLNPKAWSACIAGVSAFSAKGLSESLLLFISIYFVVCYCSIGFWAFAGQRISGWLNQPSYQRLFNMVMGSSLIGIALYLVCAHALN